MSEQPINLVPYDPAWPSQFESERAQLEAALAPWLMGRIEHIGSTAIPGIVAKPIIDIMAPVADLESSVNARVAVAALDYQYFPYRPEVMHWFCKPSAAHRTHHLHLVPLGSELWNARLMFRDYLRRSPKAAEEYANLKTELAERFRADREAYTDAKTQFVNGIVKRATQAEG